jgi:hypothetical protein
MAEVNTTGNKPKVDLTEANNKSLDLLVEIADPFFELLKDPEFSKLYVVNVLDAIKYACANHKEKIIKIAAALDGKPVDEYIVNPFTMPLKIVTAIAMYSKLSTDLFTSADQNTDKASSASAMESTEAQEEQTFS